MSGILKSVKKVFKKVVKVAKKVAPYALAAAAIFFTGGAALGVAGAAGGWGAAATTLTSSMGLSGTLGTIVTGAITQAGYGAAIGGVMGAATGKGFGKGAAAGAVTGAITGGLMGGAGMQTDPLAGKFDVQQAGVTQPSGAVTYAVPEQALAKAVPWDGVSAGPNVGGGGLFSKGGWLERNQALAGNVVSGLGQGLSNSGEAEAEMEAVREKYDRIAQNYGGFNMNSGYRPLAPGSSQKTPTQRFDPKTYGAWEYRYDPSQGRIVRAPVGQ